MKKLGRRESYNGQNFRLLSRFFCFFFWFIGSTIYAQQNPLNEVMALDLPKIKAVRENVKDHQVQLLLIKIEEKNQSLAFKNYRFQQEDSTYSYPASTVKLPIAFFLAGTILVNKNEIFNDDTYEFEEKGIPFLAEVGRQLYLSIKNNQH